MQQPRVRARDRLASAAVERSAMPDDEAVEGLREHLLEAATRGGAIVEGTPADRATECNAIVKAHHLRIEGGPSAARSADVVDQVGDHQRGRRSMHEHGFVESKAVDVQLRDDTFEI